MVSYKGLEKLLEDKGVKKSDLTKEIGLSSRTVAKIAKGEKLANGVIARLCAYFGCLPSDIFKVISDNKILQTLRDEKSAGVSGGLYHELQVRMTYNSNHIEGSRLSEDQTRYIFETHTVNAENVPVDDVIETVHHFRAIDTVIDCAEDVLTEDLIKKLHYILKHDTADESLDWFNVGEYKSRANVVGGKDTTHPKDVAKAMKRLIADYNALENVTIENIIKFHADFERIHPFQDGNGRVGRLIALKECLRHNIVPFLIEDTKKAFYYRGLSEWERDDAYLIGTCLDGQNVFKKMLDKFEIGY